ncbi:succinyldiaminopimelate transaminase [Niveibacterium terrae]|uniref:succinyldiaminopimelate transaminase n=1 Tax=Niveibacterium terrae TaxID=3373598 RepID=UPI003A92EFC0
MNPRLDLLQPYPFARLRELLAGLEAPAGVKPVPLYIGEPRHPAPELVREALAANFGGLSSYPATQGSADLRGAIARWLERRYDLPAIDVEREVLPVNGSREALFSFAQAIIDPRKPAPLIASPNPFYQIYEGAALLAGARPVFLAQTPANGFSLDLASLSDEQWARVELFYVCSPANPTGRVLTLDEWRALFELADRHDFVIASDECYSEIYFDEARPPLGALEAAHKLGRPGWKNLVVFSSLSKRSNVPGMRSGFVAGDAELLSRFLLYRTYHGCAMSPMIQAASIAAWRDEVHVRENRKLYRDKFAAVLPILEPWLGIAMPDAGFYFWAATPVDDLAFTRELLAATGVTVLPGQFLSREVGGSNPGQGFVRIALVAELAECVDAARRIAGFVEHRYGARA